MGYPTHPFMQFGPLGPQQTMPFSQIKMEPSPTMDPTQGYHNMVPLNHQDWQRLYGPPQQHQSSVFQKTASTPDPAPQTITSHQVEEISVGESNSHSSDILEQPSVVKIVNSSNHSINVQNGNIISDDLNVKNNDALKKNRWSDKLETTRVKLSFSPKARHDIPCSSCFQQ